MAWVLFWCGVFAICGGAFNWDWFMNRGKVRFLMHLFGRTGARVFYVVLGAALVVMGILVFLEGHQVS